MEAWWSLHTVMHARCTLLPQPRRHHSSLPAWLVLVLVLGFVLGLVLGLVLVLGLGLGLGLGLWVRVRVRARVSSQWEGEVGVGL